MLDRGFVGFVRIVVVGGGMMARDGGRGGVGGVRDEVTEGAGRAEELFTGAIWEAMYSR